MHAESGVFEEAASLPAEGEMQHRREQDDVRERGRLHERRQPVLEARARGLLSSSCCFAAIAAEAARIYRPA